MALLPTDVRAYLACCAWDDILIPRFVAASHCVFVCRIVLMAYPGMGARLICVIFWEVVATAVVIIPIIVLLDKIEVVGPVARPPRLLRMWPLLQWLPSLRLLSLLFCW